MPRRRSRLVLLLLLLGAGGSLAGARGAHADGQWQAAAAATTGVTDNVLSATAEPPMGLRGPEFDEFSTVSPGLWYTRFYPRAAYVVRYDFDASLYATHSEANSYTNRLTLRGAFETAPTHTLLTQVTATVGKLNQFDTTVPGMTGLNVLPRVSEWFLGVSGQEAFAVQLSPLWSVQEQTVLTGHRSLEDPIVTPTTADVDESVRFERGFEYDALSLAGRAEYTGTFFPPVAGGTMLPSTHQILYGAEARWRHDLTRTWSSELSGGAVILTDATDPTTHNGPLPVATGGLHWVKDESSINVTATHAVRANQFTGATFVADEALVAGTYPLDVQSGVRLGGQIGYQHGTQVSADANAPSLSTDLFRGELALSFDLGAGMTLAAHYIYVDQRNQDPTGVNPGYRRQSAMLTFFGTFPDRTAAEVPGQLPQRVDGADQQPVFEAPHEAEPAGGTGGGSGGGSSH